MIKQYKGEKKDLEDLLLKTAEVYLKSKGWKVLVIGGISTRQRDLKYNFEFIVNFTAKKNEETK